MKVPKVSAVITTYNRPRLLERALCSALTQTYPNLELHVVDDASADKTRCVLERLVHAREDVHYWRHKDRRGLSAARNTGIARSTGDYIAFLDDDDEWKPDCIEKRIAALQKLSPKDRECLGVVYCGCEIHIPHENRVTYNMPRIEGNIKKYIINNDLSTIPSSCLFPKKVLQAIGGFDESLSSSIDHDIWMNLAVHEYHAFAVKEPLVITYHTRKRKSMVSETTSRIQGVEQYLKKWTSTYEQWFGRAGAKSYILRYRIRVLGNLAGRKLFEGELSAAWRIVRHVTSSNIWSPVGWAMLLALMGRHLLRAFVPGKLICAVKARGKTGVNGL